MMRGEFKSSKGSVVRRQYENGRLVERVCNKSGAIVTRPVSVLQMVRDLHTTNPEKRRLLLPPSPWRQGENNQQLDHIYSETEGHPGHADNASQEEQQSLLNVAVRVGVNRLYEKLREQQEVTHAAN